MSWRALRDIWMFIKLTRRAKLPCATCTENFAVSALSNMSLSSSVQLLRRELLICFAVPALHAMTSCNIVL